MRNTLSQNEVAIIKKLLELGEYKNQEIAGLINRHRGNAESDISSGRISNIKNDQIQKYVHVKPAKDSSVEHFFKELELMARPESEEMQSPVSCSALQKFLPIRSSAPLCLNITETDQIECKKSFNYPLKTIAAFANNKGGYLVFGVKDKTWEVLGLDAEKLKTFQEFDLKKINQSVRSALGIDLQLQKVSYKVEGVNLGILYVAPAHTKPLIFINSANDGDISIAEGHIYYRYPGEDRLISPVDLQRIIEDRIKQLSQTILADQISKILQIGPTNAAILDTKSGVVDGPSGNFVIEKDLLTELSFIKEGEFSEEKGAPTLKLMGELKPVGHVVVKEGYQNITNEDMIKCFLEQEEVSNPISFIRHLKSTQTKWLPLYYYAHLAKLKKNDAIKILQEEGGLKSSTKFQINRLKNNGLPKFGGGTEECAQCLKSLFDYEVDDLTKAEKVEILRSTQRLDRYDVNMDYLLDLLKKVVAQDYQSADDSYKSLIRSAIACADSIYFNNY